MPGKRSRDKISVTKRQADGSKRKRLACVHGPKGDVIEQNIAPRINLSIDSRVKVGTLFFETLRADAEFAKYASIFEEEKIELVVSVNTNSNPGNPPLALALVLLSEHLGIPVVSNNHDFFWEDGRSELVEWRDAFFKNHPELEALKPNA